MKCSGCGGDFDRSDLVMRARERIYHVSCFRCSTCARPLAPGDEFALRDGVLLCRHDNDVVLRNASTSTSSKSAQERGPAAKRMTTAARGRRQRPASRDTSPFTGLQEEANSPSQDSSSSMNSVASNSQAGDDVKVPDGPRKGELNTAKHQ